MFRLRQMPRQMSRLEQPRSAFKNSSWSDCLRSQSRAGLAFTEILLIILVPSLCLTAWALCDADLKTTLLAGPTRDPLATTNPVYEAINMENGTVLTVQGQGQLRFWNLNTSVMLGEMQSHLNEVRCVAYSASQRLLAVGSAMGRVEVWDLNHPEMPIISEGPPVHEVSDCAFTPDGKTLITCGDDGLLLLWDPRTLEMLGSLGTSKAEESLRTVTTSRDGKLVLVGTHTGLVHVWDLEQRKLLHVHRVSAQSLRPEAAVETVAVLDGNDNFIAATRFDGIAVWNLKTGECVQRFAGEFRGLRSGTISGDEKVFIAGNEKGLVTAWDTATGKQIGSSIHKTSIVRALACSTNGNQLLSGEWSGRIQCQPAVAPAIPVDVVAR